MREIKFRAWDKTQNKMIFNFLQEGAKSFGQYRIALSFNGQIFAFTDWEVANYEEDEMHNTSQYINRFELMQYTGLKDKNGKEIYEGDILDLTYFLTKEKGIVKFGQFKNWAMSNDYECGNQGFYVDVTNDEHKAWRNDLWFYHSNCEVIGNIYEHPELL